MFAFYWAFHFYDTKKINVYTDEVRNLPPGREGDGPPNTCLRKCMGEAGTPAGWPLVAPTTRSTDGVTRTVVPWLRQWEYLCTNAKIAQYINKNNITVLTPEGLLVLISGTWMITLLQDTLTRAPALGAWGHFDVIPWLSWRPDHSSAHLFTSSG